MSISEEPKIDCHVHVFDPERFPYRTDTHYAPTGQELSSKLASFQAAPKSDPDSL